MENEKKHSALVRSSAAEYLTFVASTGEDKDSIEMRYEDENIWLTQKMMATLYDVGLPTINEHIKKIYADHEQDEAAAHVDVAQGDDVLKLVEFAQRHEQRDQHAEAAVNRADAEIGQEDGAVPAGEFLIGHASSPLWSWRSDMGADALSQAGHCR